jgi:hypothetical protein
VVEKAGKIAEVRHEHADGSFVERDGHVSISPARAGVRRISGRELFQESVANGAIDS